MLTCTEEQQEIRDRIYRFTDRFVTGDVKIITSVSDFMNIYRGQIYRIGGKDFFITGDTYEPRFGITDQPKFWVKRAVDMETGESKIIKFIFNEEFIAQIGPLRIRCYRNPEKESDVLDLVKGDSRFMQGVTLKDDGGNEARVIDFIKGQSLYAYVIENPLRHEEYYYTVVPGVLKNILISLGAIKFLHDNKLCHGDIRNDHILIDRETGQYRWIDFDLKQNYLDFDLWSFGNVLSFIIGKGIRTFYEVNKSERYSTIKDTFNSSDASAFFNYRIMNLYKLFPYISKKLNDILLHFTFNTRVFYENIESISEDLNDAISEFPNDGKKNN